MTNSYQAQISPSAVIARTGGTRRSPARGKEGGRSIGLRGTHPAIKGRLFSRRRSDRHHSIPSVGRRTKRNDSRGGDGVAPKDLPQNLSATTQNKTVP